MRGFKGPTPLDSGPLNESYPQKPWADRGSAPQCIVRILYWKDCLDHSLNSYEYFNIWLALSLTEWQYKRLMDMTAAIPILGSGGNGPCSQPRRCSRFEFVYFESFLFVIPVKRNVAGISEQLMRCCFGAHKRGKRRNRKTRNSISCKKSWHHILPMLAL